MSSFTGGNPAGFTGGNAVPGALKTPIPAVWVVCRTEGITQSGIEPEGSNIVVRGSVFTATATRAGYGNFNRFEVNGAFATSGHVLSLDIPMDSSGDTFDVAAVYDPFGMKVIVR